MSIWSAGRGSSWGGFNYAVAFKFAKYGAALRTTALFVCVAVAAELVLGFALALALKDRFRGRAFALTALLVPMMLPPAVIALFWKLVLNGHYGHPQPMPRRAGAGPTPVDYRSRPQAAVDFAG